jgi:mRNA interferase MazF
MSRWSGWSPGRGDVVTARTESGARQAALVISPASYGEKTGFALVCPITDTRTEYPFEVAVPPGLDGCRVVLADRIISLDVRAWGLVRIGALGDEVVLPVLARLWALIGMPDGT